MKGLAKEADFAPLPFLNVDLKVEYPVYLFMWIKEDLALFFPLRTFSEICNFFLRNLHSQYLLPSVLILGILC